jgi:hypothetical protein
MTTPRPGSRAEQRRRTEARILDAAATVFVADGYERARLASEPVASLALLRSMLTNPEAASAASAGIARYEAQIARAGQGGPPE